MTSRTDDRPSDADEAERRRAEFHADYGRDGQFESDVLCDCLVATHGFLSDIAGEISADLALDALVGSVFSQRVSQGAWRAVLDDNNAYVFSDLPMGVIFHDLNAYAYEGVVLSERASVSQRRKEIEGLLERAGRFHDRIPFELWNIKGGDLERTVLLARGRWALDNGEPVTPQALAIFGGVTERRIRNMMSKTEGLLPNAGGRIPAAEALDWLRGRPKHFRPSVWKEQDPGKPLDLEPGRLERVVFVPVGSDGSVFHPGLKRNGQFLLGAEAEDLVATDYEEALAQLQSMITPVWRRPTGREHWTRVQGVRWQRMTMDELTAVVGDV